MLVRLLLFLWPLLWEALGTPEPLPDEVYRFPPRSVCTSMRDCNRAYARHCEWMMALNAHDAWWWHEAFQEANQCYKAWDLLDDAWIFHEPHEGPPGASWEGWEREQICRAKLAELRRVIGGRRFHEGAMPPCVPLHRFARLD